MQFPYRRLEENCDECSREENERRDRENPEAHSIYIRTVSSLVNWFKGVYGPFVESNMMTVHLISAQTSQEEIILLSTNAL